LGDGQTIRVNDQKESVMLKTAAFQKIGIDGLAAAGFDGVIIKCSKA
jgi:hypothetical protein